jgi:thioredoxin-like negative regulator of GroEL
LLATLLQEGNGDESLVSYGHFVKYHSSMHSTITYIFAAAAGVLVAHFTSRAPELRSMRLSQLILVPAAFVVGLHFLPEQGRPSESGDIGNFICFLVILGGLILLLAPNIGYHVGAGVINFLENPDWTPSEEEIALRPIRVLIDKDRYHEALMELDELLKKHKPTYEALLTRAKLLYHVGSVTETESTLLGLIALTQTTQQQLTVMEFLAFVQTDQIESPAQPSTANSRRVEIHHELVLFPLSGEPGAHKEIPPGGYQVEEIFHRSRRWLKLVGEDWGNAEMWWNAIAAIPCPSAAPAKKSLLWPIVRLHQTITIAINGKPLRHRKAEAQKLFHEASQFIRNENWPRALPLLQQASACDPDRYEIAYRWIQAVRHTANDATTAQAINQVLKQSQWTENEEQMLQQLKRSVVK